MSYTLKILKQLKKARQEQDWDKYKQLQEEFSRVHPGQKPKQPKESK